MIKQLLTALCLMLAAGPLAGQSVKDEIKADLHLSASNLLAYPPPQQTKLKAAPDGKRPCHLSHYGRHGSRYLINQYDYDFAYNQLLRASRLGKLSPLGEDVMQRLKVIRADAKGRLGELTELGAQQSRDVARRMTERFPELFEGEAAVSAQSSTVLRSVLTMEHSLQQLLAMNPRLRICHDASLRFMPLLRADDRTLQSQILSPETRVAHEAFCQKHACWQRVVGSLFNDTAYVSQYVPGERMNYYLFRVASSLQNTELRKQTTLYDLFTDAEVLANWQMDNAYWYLGYGHTPLNGGQQPYVQRGLLRALIAEADSALSQSKPGVSLRFGHETSLLPLVCLAGINGYDAAIADLEQLERKGWVNYRVFPMAANLQLVFYRRNLADHDVLLRVLLNENDATLPIKTDCAPFYHWADVKAFWQKKLDSQAPLSSR